MFGSTTAVTLGRGLIIPNLPGTTSLNRPSYNVRIRKGTMSSFLGNQQPTTNPVPYRDVHAMFSRQDWIVKKQDEERFPSCLLSV